MWRTPTRAETHNQDYSNQIYLQNQVRWPSPSAERSGAKEDGLLSELRTKEGEAPQLGERCYAPGRKYHSQLTLDRAVKMWPTPTVQDGENLAGPSQWNRNSDPLNVAVMKWPTPRVSDYNNPGEHGRGGQDLRTEVGGQLNPNWVEWLMGWPIGWESLEPFDWDNWWNDDWWKVDPANMEDSNQWPTPRGQDSYERTNWKTIKKINERGGDLTLSRKVKYQASTVQSTGTIPRVAKSIPYRVDRLKALGEGQVPYCVVVAWELLSNEARV